MDRKNWQSGLGESEARGGRDGADRREEDLRGKRGWVSEEEETRVGRLICTTTQRTKKAEETKLGNLLELG